MSPPAPVMRRRRGFLGLGTFAAACWALRGGAIGTVVLVFDPASIDLR